jgi:hypothetical protein
MVETSLGVKGNVTTGYCGRGKGPQYGGAKCRARIQWNTLARSGVVKISRAPMTQEGLKIEEI